MDHAKLAALMYIGAGIFFVISAFLGGKLIYLPLAVALIILGLRKLRDAGQPEDEA